MTRLRQVVLGVFVFVCYLLGNVKLVAIQGETRSTPYFGLNNSRNVTTTVGLTTYLHCEVNQLGDKAVSWIRKRDLHILSIGFTVFSSDQRFQIIHSDKSTNWTLQIKFPQLRDSGIYECQVNTEPKMYLPYTLNVVEAEARILGNTDVHVQEGSRVTFTCTVTQGPHDLNTVYWHKENKMLQTIEDNSIQRIRVENTWTDVLTSQLHITNVNLSDSGKYTCVPTAASPAHANLYVIAGEHPAAMHHGNRNTSPQYTPISMFNLLAIIIISALTR